MASRGCSTEKVWLQRTDDIGVGLLVENGPKVENIWAQQLHGEACVSSRYFKLPRSGVVPKHLQKPYLGKFWAARRLGIQQRIVAPYRWAGLSTSKPLTTRIIYKILKFERRHPNLSPIGSQQRTVLSCLPCSHKGVQKPQGMALKLVYWAEHRYKSSGAAPAGAFPKPSRGRVGQAIG
jgi:hypothetical protein